MAVVRQTVTKTTKKRYKKKSGSPDRLVCNVCHGVGTIPNWHKKKK